MEDKSDVRFEGFNDGEDSTEDDDSDDEVYIDDESDDFCVTTFSSHMLVCCSWPVVTWQTLCISFTSRYREDCCCDKHTPSYLVYDAKVTIIPNAVLHFIL